LCSLAQGETEVDLVGEAQSHGILVKLAEPEGRSIFRQAVKIHLEKINGKFTVDIVEFIFVFSIVCVQVLFAYFPEIIEIVRAFGVDAFMDDEVLAIFLLDQCVHTVGAAQFQP
jgi:hypothetical protein